ncbi:L,D-transpeptidase [Amycolatopsis anabasis]|uniref:L,D-transpeptidase n=1 Tax=Amycolatopsis anabasis TaxID=1840409 RepID=UPI00131E9D0A|nr:L,D-transpeptidase family protein [Amycolatopsis anabasis]
MESCANPSRSRKPGRNRAWFAVSAVAALAFLTAGCGGDAPEAAPAAVSQEDLTALPEANTFGSVPEAAKDSGAQPTGKVIHPKEELVVYSAVGGKAIAKLPTVQMGSPTWVPVIAEQGSWAEILLPTRPNAAAGWVHVDGGKVENAQNDYVINVARDAFSLELLQSGKKLGKWTIGTGKPEYPTPLGRAYLLASIEETVNKYSPIVLPLSFHSDSHETFGGGPGTVGIHTWPDESFVGKANSDGCIRVPKDALEALVKVPLGTIVNIT